MGQALERLQADANKGQLLELVTLDILTDMGFDAKRQQSGTQFGFDVIAVRPSPLDHVPQFWKLECKNLGRPVTLDDIAPKLIWHLGHTTIDRYIIVSTSDINTTVEHLLSDHPLPMPIEVWSGSILETKIWQSSSARQRLKLLKKDAPPPVSAPVFDPRSPALLDVTHQLNPPHAFDYILQEGKPSKFYSDFEFRLFISITNTTNTELDFRTVALHTVSYTPWEGRVLRLIKPKGIFQPLKWTLLPSTTAGGSVNFLDGNLLRIAPRSLEHIDAVLDNKTNPGLYDLMFRVDGIGVNGRSQAASPVLRLHVPADTEDSLTLNVKGRHYGSPAEDILRLDDKTWNRLKQESRKRSQMLFLGPTDAQVLGKAEYDKNWVVRAVPIKRISPNEAALNPKLPGKIIHDLGRPTDEELYSLDIAQQRSEGLDPWQGVLDKQLRRRQRK